jgi:hypothetical protein
MKTKGIKNIKIKDANHAIEILKGAGIKIEGKTQVWLCGKKYSQKVIAAGSYLDRVETSKEDSFKTKWLSLQDQAELKSK